MSRFFAPKLTAGDVIQKATNAELLNDIFGTNYKAWMKCSWKYSKDTIVWMVHIDGDKRGEGFKNVWENRDTIIQCYVGKTGTFNGISLQDVYIPDYRLVFEKEGHRNDKKYIFRGLFCYDRINSKPEKLIFHKVSDVFSN